MSALDVYLHDSLVGRLERLPQAELRFAYESSWVSEDGSQPLSLSLPLRERPFEDFECRPFFSGLLPEGEFLKAVARTFHVSASNPFSLLAEIGGECAGAVSLAVPGEEPPFLGAPAPEWLDETEFGDLLAALPSRPLLFGMDDEEDGLRLSLAGARDKLPILARESRFGITRGRPPSTHIVKTPIAGIEGMVANEAFCMALANEAGLQVAEASPIQAGDREGLLVTRYDRAQLDGAVRRIHQEDLCQALGCLPEQKYESEGGPGVGASAALLRQHSAAPAADLFAFLDALVFNLLIGNTDAHAKNYSLLLGGAEAPRLAPLYDLLSTRAYGRRFGRKMAMKYGNEYRLDRIRGRHIERLAADLEIAPRQVRIRAHRLVGVVLASTEGARRKLPLQWQDSGAIDAVVGVVTEMAASLWDALEERS